MGRIKKEKKNCQTGRPRGKQNRRGLRAQKRDGQSSRKEFALNHFIAYF